MLPDKLNAAVGAKCIPKPDDDCDGLIGATFLAGMAAIFAVALGYCIVRRCWKCPGRHGPRSDHSGDSVKTTGTQCQQSMRIFFGNDRRSFNRSLGRTYRNPEPGGMELRDFQRSTARSGDDFGRDDFERQDPVYGSGHSPLDSGHRPSSYIQATQQHVEVYDHQAPTDEPGSLMQHVPNSYYGPSSNAYDSRTLIPYPPHTRSSGRRNVSDVPLAPSDSASNPRRPAPSLASSTDSDLSSAGFMPRTLNRVPRDARNADRAILTMRIPPASLHNSQDTRTLFGTYTEWHPGHPMGPNERHNLLRESRIADEPPPSYRSVATLPVYRACDRASPA